MRVHYIRDVELRDNGTWLIEFKYNNDDSYSFKKPYIIKVIGNICFKIDFFFIFHLIFALVVKMKI